MVNKVNSWHKAWHKTRTGCLVFSLVELAIAYGFASLAIDRGNFAYYFLAGAFLFGALQNITKFTGTFIHAKR